MPLKSACPSWSWRLRASSCDGRSGEAPVDLQPKRGWRGGGLAPQLLRERGGCEVSDPTPGIALDWHHLGVSILSPDLSADHQALIQPAGYGQSWATGSPARVPLAFPVLRRATIKRNRTDAMSGDEHCVDISSVGERRLAQRRPLHPTLGQCSLQLAPPRPLPAGWVPRVTPITWRLSQDSHLCSFSSKPPVPHKIFLMSCGVELWGRVVGSSCAP